MPVRHLVSFVAIGTLIGPAAASAQFQTLYGALATFRAGSSVEIVCGTLAFPLGPGTMTATCAQTLPTGTTTYSGLGSASGGVARARFSMVGNGTAQPAEGPRMWHGLAVGQWADRLVVGSAGLAPATVEMSLLWDGTLSATSDGVLGAGEAEASWGFRAGGGTPLYAYDQSAAVAARAVAVPRAVASVRDAQTFVLPITAPGVPIAFAFDIAAQVRFGYDHADPTLAAWSTTTASEFASTARITRLVFRDAAGADVTDQVVYEFESGAAIPAVVPEPSALILVVTGVLAIGGVARKQRWVITRRASRCT